MNRKIKILFHIDELSEGGAEKVLCNLVNNLNQTNFDITLHTTFKCDESKFLNSGINYKFVFAKKNFGTKMQYRLENALGLFYALHLKHDYDIEVAYLECGPTKVIANSTNKKAIKLAWVHCDLEKKMGNDIHKFVEKTAKYYQKFDKVICVSEDCRSTFEKLYGNNPEILVIHNTIDSEEVINKAKNILNSEIPQKRGFTMVSCGRLTAQKNFMMLLKSFQKINNLHLNLWILGEGEERQTLQEFITYNHLENNVKLLGFHSNPYPIIKEADLYVCSSMYEGYSTAVVEALILGIPVITTECTGMNEILGKSEYGFISKNNEEEFTKGLLKMTTDDELLHFYKTKAKDRGVSLSGKQAAQQTEDFFESLLR